MKVPRPPSRLVPPGTTAVMLLSVWSEPTTSPVAIERRTVSGCVRGARGAPPQVEYTCTVTDFDRVDHTDVLLALTEYDELGSETFLDTYGFRPARTYLLVHDGKTYDSKAVLGVAHGYATGRPATSEEFSGGLEGAVQVLEALGFEVQAGTDPEAEPEPRDASDVGSLEARAAWAEAARPVLLESAGRYRATVTYTRLAAAVQQASGITTPQPMHQWIGDVLARVTDESQSRGEPLLSSLCVTSQGSVGQAYADAVEHARGPRPADPDDHAARERLDCYRHWQAAGLPGDGGTPLRTAHFTPVRRAAQPKAARRTATPRKTAARKPAAAAATPAPEPKPMQLCPRCFTQVPASGVCDYCD